MPDPADLVPTRAAPARIDFSRADARDIGVLEASRRVAAGLVVGLFVMIVLLTTVAYFALVPTLAVVGLWAAVGFVSRRSPALALFTTGWVTGGVATVGLVGVVAVVCNA